MEMDEGNPLIEEVQKLRRQVQALERYTQESEGRTLELQQTKDKFQRLLDNIQDIYFELNEDGTILELSPSVELLSRYKREELIGKPLYATCFDVSQRADFLAALQKEGKVYEYEVTLKDRDGSPLYTEVSAKLSLKENGFPRKIVGIMRNISEKKKSEDALKKSKEKYRQLVESSSSIMLRMDKNGQITFFNEYALAFFGYKEEEIIGKNVIGTIVPEMESTGRDLQAMIRNIGANPDKYVNNVNENIKKSGERIWISWSNRANFDQSWKLTDILCIGNDITSYKMAENALRDSLQFNGEIIKNASEGIVVYDSDLQYVVWNRFMENLSGITADRVLGKNAAELFPHLIEQGIDVLICRALQGETVHAPDAYFFIKDTKKKGWVSAVYSPNRNYRGDIIGVVVVVRDITQRKTMEEALQAAHDTMESKIRERTAELQLKNEQLMREIAERQLAEKRFRDLAELLPQAVFETDESGKITWINRQAYEIFGYSEDDFKKGLNAIEALIPQDRDRATIHCGKNWQGENLQGSIYTGQRKDGSTFPIIVYSSPIVSEGKPVGTRGIIADISAHRRIENALIESETKYRELFENANDIIYIHDLNWQIIACNAAALHAYGYELEETIGADITKIVDPGYLPILKIKLQEQSSGRSVKESYELLTHAKNGAPIWVELSTRTIIEKDVPVAIQGIARNITERKLADEVLKKRERELEEKTQSLQELNTALNVLLKKRDEDKKDLEERFLCNVQELVLPYIEKLKLEKLDSSSQTYLKVIESGLQDILSPFLRKLTTKTSQLTPKEIQIANLIKSGLTTKEIAGIMKVSKKAIDFHRDSLRKKLGLKHSQANLSSYLASHL
jgi:PAS domain S-box-containing protein